MTDKKRGGDSVPPEARRRGGMDTLFSAPWFDEAQQAAGGGGGSEGNADLPTLEEEKPKRSNTVLYVVLGVAVLVLFPMLLCGLSVIAGAIWYATNLGLI